MTSYLVDTDWIIDCLHGQRPAIDTIMELAPRGLLVSIISYGELYEGAYYARNPQEKLEGLRNFLEGKEILPLTLPIVERFGIVRGSLASSIRQQIGDMDLLIAATALEHKLTVLTRNVRDFAQIPGLKFHQPDQPTD